MVTTDFWFIFSINHQFLGVPSYNPYPNDSSWFIHHFDQKSVSIVSRTPPTGPMLWLGPRSLTNTAFPAARFLNATYRFHSHDMNTLFNTLHCTTLTFYVSVMYAKIHKPCKVPPNLVLTIVPTSGLLPVRTPTFPEGDETNLASHSCPTEFQDKYIN